MPTNCSSTGEGSNQPAPSQSQIRGSNTPGPSNAGANGSTTVVNGDNLPPKTKSTLPGAVKQRSKRRAEPSPSSIIEISSDEDEPPTKKPAAATHHTRKRIKNLEEENRRLKAALESALEACGTVQPPVKPEEEVLVRGLVVTTEKLISSIEELVTCEICTSKMWSPYSLSCGHTFCGDCLHTWFATAYATHLEYRPGYNLQTLIPSHLFTLLAQPNLPSFQRCDVIQQIANTVGSTTHPKYSCPTCRLFITTKPAENFVIKNVVQMVAETQGQSAPERPIQPSEGPFHRFFPWARWL